MSKRVSFGSAAVPDRAAKVQAFVDQGSAAGPSPAAPKAKATSADRNTRLNFIIEDELRHRFKLACTAQRRTIQEVMTELVEGWTAKNG